MSVLFRCLTALCLSALLLTSAAAAPDTLEQRKQFQSAYEAVPRDNKPITDSKLLQRYVLYPYLQAARLSRQLQNLSTAKQLDERIGKFLAANLNAPATRDLRHQWLLSLAARAEWKLFVAQFVDDGDAELRCQNLTALIATHRDHDAASLIPQLWLNSDRLPGACNAVFQWGRDNQIITATLIDQRARLALKAGNYQLAHDLLQSLPADQATPLMQWIQMIEDPVSGINTVIARRDMPIDAAILLDGWTRLSRKYPDIAELKLRELIESRKLDESEASPFYLSLALSLAWNRRSETPDYFSHVIARDMTDQAYEWRARAALWRGDWSLVNKLIDAMPATLKSQVRWRYWQIRAAERTLGIDAARAGYLQLVNTEDNYFAALAAARINSTYVPHPQSFNFDAALTQRLANTPDIQRIHELVATRLMQQATTEWNNIIVTLSPAELLAAANLAHEWKWYDQAILLTAKQSLFSDYEFLYPRPFEDEVAVAGKLSGLPVDFIYAQLRQESLYRQDARSTAGALGLMQLLPASARQTARQFKRTKPSDDDLYKPEHNIPLGAAHMRQMIDAFKGQVVVALAAYNGGPTAVRRWMPDSSMDSDVWIENIPFNETRVYVPRILWHSVIFEWLRTGEPVNTTQWLKPVVP